MVGFHEGKDRLHHEHHTFEVDVVDIVEKLFGHLFYKRKIKDSGIIDKNIDPLPTFPCQSRDSLSFRFDADISLNRQYFRTNFL